MSTVVKYTTHPGGCHYVTGFINTLVRYLVCHYLLIYTLYRLYRSIPYRVSDCAPPAHCIFTIQDHTYLSTDHDIMDQSMSYCCSSSDDFFMYHDLNYNNNSNLNPNDVLVVNLSDYQLTKPDRDLLARGPKFCPTPGEPDFGELRSDLNS